MKKNILKIVFFLVLIMYLFYHTLNGRYGILSYKNINDVLLDKKDLLKKKQEKVNVEKNKIIGLNINSIDMDLFDEKLKENVGIVEDNEVVIFVKDINSI